MTFKEATLALEKLLVVQHKDDTRRWGHITAISDDESTAYVQRNGCGLSRYSTTLESLEIDWQAHKKENYLP